MKTQKNTPEVKSKVTFENFFLNTFANFEKISSDERKMLKNTKPDFISKSGSTYWYLNGYVYRHSSHFSRDTRTCAWFLEGKSVTNNVLGNYGKCKLEDFVQINTNAEIGKKYKIIYAPRDRRLSLIHISEHTRLLSISYAVFCLKNKKKKHTTQTTYATIRKDIQS